MKVNEKENSLTMAVLSALNIKMLNKKRLRKSTGLTRWQVWKHLRQLKKKEMLKTDVFLGKTHYGLTRKGEIYLSILKEKKEEA